MSLELDAEVTVYPASGSTVTGETVDLQGAESALIILQSGAASTARTIKVEHSANGSDWSAVDDDDLIGLTGNSSGVAQTASSVVTISYVGTKRYVRVSSTAGSNALFSAIVVKGHLRHTGGEAV